MRTLKLLLILALGSVMPSFAQVGVCSSKANISISASGTTMLVPAAAGLNVHICDVTFSTSAAVTVTFVAINGGGNTNISGGFPTVGTFGYNYSGNLSTGVGNGFGITISTTATVGGVVTYYVSTI
jgi:hypothetical protein